MNWIKTPTNGFRCQAGPFVMSVEPKADGRWAWQVCKDGTLNPTATGIAASLGASKTVTEQFVKRSGLV